MSKIKNGGLDQYSAGPFGQQQFGTAGVERVKLTVILSNLNRFSKLLHCIRKPYMPRQSARQPMTLSDLEWLFHAGAASRF